VLALVATPNPAVVRKVISALIMTYHYHGKVALAFVLGLSTSLYLSNFAPFTVIKPSVRENDPYPILGVRIHFSVFLV